MIRPSYSRPRAAFLAIAQPSRLSVQARLALMTGGVMMALLSLSSLGLLAAHADEKSDRRERQYKVGATILGGAALYYGIKKKNPVGAAVAGAGAYYAYKKGQKANRESGRDRYGRGSGGPRIGSSRDSYPDSDGYDNGDRDYRDRDRDHRGYPARAPRDGYNGNGYPVDAPGDGYDSDSSYPRDVSGDDYGVDNGPDYARNGDDYPNYGLNGLAGRRKESASKRGAANAPGHGRRITVK